MAHVLGLAAHATRVLSPNRRGAPPLGCNVTANRTFYSARARASEVGWPPLTLQSGISMSTDLAEVLDWHKVMVFT